MIPITTAIDGPATPEMATKLVVVKWCVLAVYVCALGRLFAGDALGALNDFFAGLFGTFLMKEDPHLQGCYRCLHETPIGALGPGGLSCLMPYIFLAGINGIFGLVRVYTLLRAYGTLVPCSNELQCFLPALLAVSTVAQLVSVYYCWQVYKLQQVQAYGGALRAGMYEHTPGDSSGGDHAPADAPGAGGRGQNIQMNPFSANSFQPFQGTGHQLGER